MTAMRLLTRQAIFVVALLSARAAGAGEWSYLVSGEPVRSLCGAAPEGWTTPEFDDGNWGPPKLTDGGTPEKCDALHVRRRFDVGPEIGKVQMLRLQVRYQDGFVAWLNGVEIARRRFLGGEALLAAEPHGPEAERIFVPVQAGMLRASGNVLAVEAHPFRVGRAAIAEVALGGSDAPRIIRGPHLLRNLGGEATIAIDTDQPARAELRFSLRGDEQHEQVVSDARLDTHHELRLPGLIAARTYRYRVVLRGAAGEGKPVDAATAEAAFHTPPTASHPLRFVVMGDVRSGHAIHDSIVKAVVAEDPDLVLMTGDLVDIGSDDAEWQRYFDIEAPLLRQVPVYSAVGNHDGWRKSEGLSRFQALFGRGTGPTWWSFDVSGVHFVLLDSESYKNPDQLAWLKDDLAAARAKNPRAIFACMHHGPWSSALHGDNAIAIHDYVPVLEAAGVKLLFAGHDHDYERGKVGELNYVVSGGGGAELRTQRCGIAGKKKCGPRVRAFANEHHYVVVELSRAAGSERVKLCPKRPDGTLLEECPVIQLGPVMQGKKPANARGRGR